MESLGNFEEDVVRISAANFENIEDSKLNLAVSKNRPGTTYKKSMKFVAESQNQRNFTERHKECIKQKCRCLV